MARKKKSFDYQYWFYDNQYDSALTFIQFLEDLVRDKKLRVNVLLVASKVPLQEELDWSPKPFSVTIKNKPPVFTMTSIKKVDGTPVARARAVVVRYENTPIYMIISDSRATDFKQAVTKLMRRHYPTISRVFLTTSEIRKILQTLEKKMNCEIEVDSSMGERHIVGRTKSTERQITYTNKPYQEVFDDIESKDGWLQSIKFTTFRKQKRSEENKLVPPGFSGFISRDCFLSCKRDFRPIIQTIIPMAIQFVSKRYHYMDVRAQTAPATEPEPVVIKFDKQVFTDISQNKPFIKALGELEHCSVSAYHSNPYVHVSLLDYLDGSSYDIWVVSTDRIVVIPQLSASAASLDRLLNHVYEIVREGHVEDYAEAITV